MDILPAEFGVRWRTLEHVSLLVMRHALQIGFAAGAGLRTNPQGDCA
jgi:hypothetical protein